MNDEHIKNQALKFFKTELAANVWMSKYALRNNGEIIEQSPEEMFNRIYKEIIRIDRTYDDCFINYDDLYNMMINMDFILGGSNLFGIGNNNTLTSLSNCYVVGNEIDSYGGILQTDQELVQLAKRRGGVGTDISHIRPKGASVNNAAGSSTGIVPFMERYSNSIREVAMDGRRGALILTINVLHPEIENFLFSKDDLTKITGANISIKLTDDFMRAVEKDEDVNLQFPVDSDNPTIVKTIKARELWNKIIKQAWKSAEPGLLFWNTIIRESPADCYMEEGFKTVSCNPCSELNLCFFDSCRLLAINLFNAVDNPFTKNAKLNEVKLRTVAYYAQVVMDDIIDLEEEKINKIIDKINDSDEPCTIKDTEMNLWFKILEKLLKGRRTGIGIMGLADMFASLNIQYGSDESIQLAEKVSEIVSKACYEASIDMAESRGSFPIWNFDKERNHPFINRVLKRLSKSYIRSYNVYGRRQIANLTVAPTGSIAILAGISSGIEPVYNIYYERKVKVQLEDEHDSIDALGDCWKRYLVIHPKFEQWYKLNYPEGVDLVLFSTKELDELIQDSPYKDSCAYQIDSTKRVKLQGVIQKNIDHSISSTINLSKEATVEQVSDIYMSAWKEGLKGITVYREGSREGVLSINSNTTDEFNYHDAPKRPKDIPGELHQLKVRGEKYVAVIGLFNNKPYEIFCRKDDGDHYEAKGIIRKIRKKRFDYITENNGIANLQDEQELLHRVITILVSALLRHGAKPQFIIHAIDKFNLDVSSLVSAIQRVLKKYVADGTTSHENCPECNNKLIYEAGCNICKHCGHSRCN